MPEPNPVYKAKHQSLEFFRILKTTAYSAMVQNTTTERFLAGNSKWRPTWDTPATMEQMRKYGEAPNNPLMIGTSYTFADGSL